MKKLIPLLVAAFVLLAPAAGAQELYWHNQDSYSVELDGEGDAFVVASMTFEGISASTNVSSVNLEIPGRSVRVYKVIQTPAYYYGGYAAPDMAGNPAQFLEYTLTPLSRSTQITILLKTPIQPNTQTAINIIYQTQDVASPTFQGLEFNFETIKDPVSTVRASGANIFVPQEMELKGKPRINVQYLPSDIIGSAATKSAAEMSSQIYPYYRYPSYQYSARNLDPGESFTVSGLYGSSTLLLYFWEIVAAAAVAAAVTAAFLYFRLDRRIRSLFGQTDNQAKARPERRQAPTAQAPSLGGLSMQRTLIMGIVTAFLYTLASFFSQFIFSLANMLFSGSTPYMLSIVIVLVAMFGIPVIALFGPPYYMHRRYGWKEGLMTFVFAVLFIALLLILMAPLYSNGYRMY